MKKLNYYKKIRCFSFTEKIKLLKYSLGSILVNSVPKTLKHSYHFSQNLQFRNIKIIKKDENIVFNYPVHNSILSFELKRNSSDTFVFQQIIELEEYKSVIDIIHLHKIDVLNIIDAGSNIGLTSLYLRQYFSDAKIILLEPEKSTYKRMLKNLELNNYSKMFPLNFGLWKKETTLEIDRNFRDREDWSVRLTSNVTGKNTIETKTIVGLITEYNLKTIDLLKIDIEGAEKELFLEDPDILLWLPKVKVIALEIHDETMAREKIEAILADFGFELSYSGELSIGINKKFI